MTPLNALLVTLSDLVLSPLASLPPLAVLTGAALATALVVLAVMRLTSNQAAVATVKRRIHASLLEMRLYNDDVRALLRAQGDVLAQNARYIGLSLVPLVITAVPLTFAIAQLQAWYGYAGLTPGIETTVTATFDRPVAAVPTLKTSALEVVGVPRYFPTRHEVVWKVVPRIPGGSVLTVVTSEGATIEKTLQVAGDGVTARRSPSRDRASFWQQLLYPSEAPLDPATGVTSIAVPYGERAFPVAGLELHWLIAYLGLSLVFVLALRGPLGVVI